MTWLERLRNEWRVAKRADAHQAKTGAQEEPPMWEPEPGRSRDEAMRENLETFAVDCPTCGASAHHHCRRMQRDEPPPTPQEKRVFGKWARRQRQGDVLVGYHQARRDALRDQHS